MWLGSKPHDQANAAKVGVIEIPHSRTFKGPAKLRGEKVLQELTDMLAFVQ